MEVIYCLFGLFLVLGCVFYFLVAPNVKHTPADRFTGVRFAHRGLYGGEVNENSMRAFSLAVESGYGIELDTRLTADGKVVVFHDDSLLRMCGVDRAVSEVTYDSLPLLPDGSRIPLFSEVLALTVNVPLLVELKGENGDTEVCVKCNELLSGYNGSYCVESFNPMYMKWYKKHCPGIARGQLVTYIPYVGSGSGKGKLLGFALRNLLTNFMSRPHFIASSIFHADSGPVNFCKSIFGTPVFVWTPRGEEATASASERFDAVIFEDARASSQPVKYIGAH